MSLQDGQRGAGLETPHPDGLVARAGGDHGVLVADGHVGDLGGVAAQRRQQAAVVRAPDLDEAVVRALAAGSERRVQIEVKIWYLMGG